MRTRLLFVGVVVPLGTLGRPLWRRRLGLRFDRRATSYWRRRSARPVGADDLRA